MRFSRGAISRGQKLDAVSINTTTLILIGLTMALLEIQDLTMQFGGLTAVNAVTARVEPGQIFSIIGPNGAGKTTVFNAVTGIYDPTAGQILFHDRELRRPFTWKTVLLCALSGILTAIAVTLLTANVDRLWLATIKNPYNNQPDTFSLKTVWHDLLGYFHGEPVVERNSGFAARRQPWRIATADRRQTLNEVLGRRPQDLPPPKKGEPQERFARAYFADLQAVLSLPEADRQPRREGDDWLIRSPGSDKILAQYDSEDDAQTKTEIINQILHAQVATPLMAILSLLGGLVLGAAGAFVVWQRSRRTPDVISLGGIARTFQNIRLFQNMTVLENVLLGMDRSYRCGWIRALFRTPAWRREERSAKQQALELLRFIGLADKPFQLAKNLPYGDQRRLEIARALATRPQVLLLDEPAAGMNPSESGELTKLIRRIRDDGTTVLLIEHHMKVVMGISDRIAVLDYGSKIAEGTPSEVRANPRVIEAYLGKEVAN